MILLYNLINCCLVLYVTAGMSKKIGNIHDKFIKRLLADKEMAISFLKEYLPGQLSALIDFDTLTYQNTSYISNELKSSFSDTVWQVQLHSKHKLSICLLLEHKSYIEPHVTFQILEYLALGYRKQLSEGKEPELIVPILYYHGKKQWSPKSLVSYFPALPPLLAGYLPAYESLFINLFDMSPGQIENLKDGLLKSAIFLQKYYFDPKEFNRSVFHILESLNPYLDSKIVDIIFVYAMQNKHLRRGSFKKKIESISETQGNRMKTRMMSLYDQLIHEGIEKGRQEEKIDVIKNLILSGRFTLSEIANFTSVTEGFVKKVMDGSAVKSHP